MIQLNRNYNLPEKADEDISIKVVGVGGAGSNVLDRIVLDGLDKADLIAINTDVQSLASSVATQKMQIGREITRGLGAGGDPELGYNAAQESADEHSLHTAGDLKLQAGMPAEVYIEGTKQTALQYLAEPIASTLRKAGRQL